MANRAGLDRAEVWKAATEGLAEGLRVHLPGAVGLFLKGPLICGFMAFGHFALGTDWPLSVVVGGLCGLAGVNVPAVLSWLAKNQAESKEPEPAPARELAEANR